VTEYNPKLTVTVANGIVLPVELKGAMVIKGRSTPYSSSSKKYVPVVILDAILVPGLRKDTVLLSPRSRSSASKVSKSISTMSFICFFQMVLRFTLRKLRQRT
jgi:hypothetical protein